jgi:hypothetical protein
MLKGQTSKKPHLTQEASGSSRRELPLLHQLEPLQGWAVEDVLLGSPGTRHLPPEKPMETAVPPLTAVTSRGVSMLADDKRQFEPEMPSVSGGRTSRICASGY